MMNGWMERLEHVECKTFGANGTNKWRVLQILTCTVRHPTAVRHSWCSTNAPCRDKTPINGPSSIVYNYILLYFNNPCRLVNDWPYQWSLVPVYHSSLTVFRRQSSTVKSSFFNSAGYSRKPPKLGTRLSLSINCVLITNETKHPYQLYHEKMRMGPNIQGCSV